MKNIVRIVATALITSAALVTTPALAGGGHGPQYGGVVRELHHVTYELVAKPDSLTLYMSDHGKPVPSQGAQAEATLYAGSDKTTVRLEPAGDNRMVAKGSFKVGVGVRVMLNATLPGKTEVKTTFNLK